MMKDCMPKVTVLLPVYNSRKHLKEAINSIIGQTYIDWELLIMNEYGSNDGSLGIIQKYMSIDHRIRLIQNQTRLGLAESLNEGMRLAEGKYIARMDADDIAHPKRIEQQVAYMESNLSICVSGTYQHHFGADIDWIHKPPVMPEQCKTNLLFFCDLCHSTLILRKKWFLENELFYDNNYLAEDFELWTRVIKIGEIANIPEVLGEYRWGKDNITINKKQRLQAESGTIVARTIKDTLGLYFPESKCNYFNNWSNPFFDMVDPLEREFAYLEFQRMLRQIYIANQEKQFFDEQSLLNTLGVKWKWARYGFPFNQLTIEKSIESIFQYKPRQIFLTRCYYFWIRNKSLKAKLRKIYAKTYCYLIKK